MGSVIVDQQRLKSRVAGREKAKSIIDLVGLENDHEIDGFLDELTRTLRPPKAETENRTDLERSLVQLS